MTIEFLISRASNLFAETQDDLANPLAGTELESKCTYIGRNKWDIQIWTIGWML